MKPGVPMPISLLMRGICLAPDQQAHLGGTGLERLGRIVHRRGADADHHDAPPAQRGKIDRIGRMRPALARQVLHEIGDVRLAQALAPGRQHDLAGNHLGLGGAAQRQAQQAVPAGSMRVTSMPFSTGRSSTSRYQRR